MPGKVATIPRETLIAWKNGDKRAFELIVKATMHSAYAIAVGIVGNGEDARDLSQECYVAAYAARSSFDVERPFFPWFYRILRNRCLNFIQKRARRRETSLDAVVERSAGEGNPERHAMSREAVERIWGALQRLTPEHREIIVLRSFQEYSYREISRILGISEGTVMSRLFYARKALSLELKELGEEPHHEGDGSR